jgi:hypothetical protein
MDTVVAQPEPDFSDLYERGRNSGVPASWAHAATPVSRAICESLHATGARWPDKKESFRTAGSLGRQAADAAPEVLP